MRQIFTISLIAILFCLSFISYTQKQKQEEKDALMGRQNQILETSYKAVTQMYKVSIESYFRYILLQNDVLDTLHEAKNADEAKKAILRGSLYRLLYPIYNNNLKEIGVRQLHFHTPLGESFLRFHSPTENGDSLFDIRPSVKKANIEKVFVSGFEGGRIYPGFRYVFPILNKGEHLGSIEISLPYESIEIELSKLLTCQNNILLMKKSVTSHLVFDGHKEFFIPSFFSDEFVIENQKISRISEKAIQSPLVDTINHLIKQQYDIEKLLLSGKNFATPVVDANKGYFANFHAIYDISNTLAAYAVTYGEMNELLSLEKKYLTTNLLGCFTILLFSFGIYLYLRLNQNILNKKIQFETIVNTTVNGVLLLNKDGCIQFMNHAACKILGFSSDEVQGQNAHELIHVHDATSQDEQECPILKSIKLQSFYLGEGIFKKKDGDKIFVFVNANSFIQDDKSIGSVTIFRDISQEKKDKESIEHLAYYDALTDLPNRKLLLNRLSLSIKESSRNLDFGGLLFIDLDKFKRLNDTHGHDMGDKLLQEVALRLQGQLRTCDTVSRFGGDEFIILLTKLGKDEINAKEELYKIAKKLLHAIALPYQLPNLEYICTASIGGTLFINDDETVDDILKNADAAMYEVKKEGKNEIKIF